MMTSTRQIISIKYRAPTGKTILKDVHYHGIRLRESDSAIIVALSQPEKDKSFMIEIGHIDTLWINGKTRKLKSPGSQTQFREAELKHLLDKKVLEEWTSPYLRDYFLEGALVHRNIFKRLGHAIISLFGLSLLSLPYVLCAVAGGFIAYMAWLLFKTLTH